MDVTTSHLSILKLKHVYLMILLISWIILKINKAAEILRPKVGHNIKEFDHPEIDWNLNGLDQEDVRLKEILRDYYLSFPTDLVRNITPYRLERRYISGQFGQAHIVDEYYSGSKRGGFFIEAGAYDGESVSNTLFLEMERNWTGLLVEANPDNFRLLQSRNRNVSCIETCLSRQTYPEVVDFDAVSIFGGIIVDGRPKPGDNIPITRRTQVHKIVSKTRRTIKMQCFPLTSIVYALANPVIDYLSLDIEGSELEVLKTIPFNTIKIKLISVEIIRKKLNNDTLGEQVDNFEEIVSLLNMNGYKIMTIIPHTHENLSFEVFFEKQKCDA